MGRDESDILYLCRREVEQLCAGIDLVSVIQEVFWLHGSGQTVLPDEACLTWINDDGDLVRSLNMPGYVGGSFATAGTKIINANPRNPDRGLPRASGLTLLFDNTSACIVCLMEGATISALRTAAVTALSATLLQGSDIECLALIGAGALARTHVELLAGRLPKLRYIRVFDLERTRVATLHREVKPILEATGIVLQEMDTAEEAIRRAQLIVPVTTTTTGYISFDWLEPGSLLVNVSLDDPKPEVVLRADKVVVDDWNLVKNDSRRLLGRMYRAGQIIPPDASIETVGEDRQQIYAQLGDIIVGRKPGRTSNSEIILMNPFGLSIEDVTIAARVYHAAVNLGVGMFLER